MFQPTIKGMETIHARIRRLREEKKLSKAGLASLCGATYQAVQSWERGDTAPKRARLASVALALGVTPQELAHGQQKAQETDLSEVSGLWKLLTPQQKESILSLLRSMTSPVKSPAKKKIQEKSMV